MPRVMECSDNASCALDDCIDAVRSKGFDPTDEESLHHASLWLRRLGNNAGFLGDILIEQLKDRREIDDSASGYGPPVVMLSAPKGNFFMRANIWPSRSEHAFRASGGDSFVYELPHDHNFHFLTLGYFGPGYWSDYYEFDYEALDGWSGEKAGLRFVGRERLDHGKIMLYRAHLDVHSQLPPDELSVSLNIMHMSPVQGWFDQYRFDTDADGVAGIINHGSSDVFLRIAVGLGSEEALDLADSFARRHPSDRMKLTAWEARAGRAGDPGERDEIWRLAENSCCRLVAAEARRRRAQLA